MHLSPSLWIVTYSSSLHFPFSLDPLLSHHSLLLLTTLLSSALLPAHPHHYSLDHPPLHCSPLLFNTPFSSSSLLLQGSLSLNGNSVLCDDTRQVQLRVEPGWCGWVTLYYTSNKHDHKPSKNCYRSYTCISREKIQGEYRLPNCPGQAPISGQVPIPQFWQFCGFSMFSV